MNGDWRAAVEMGPWPAPTGHVCWPLGATYDSQSWFPQPVAGETVQGAFLVSASATFPDSGAEPARPLQWSGMSTMLVTDGRLIGVCANGTSTHGALDPAAGPVVVWTFPRRAGGWARLVDDGAGRTQIEVAESAGGRPFMLINGVQRASPTGYAASQPAELVAVLNNGAVRPAPTGPAPTGPAPTAPPAPDSAALAVVGGWLMLTAVLLAVAVALPPMFNDSKPFQLTPAWDESGLNLVITIWKLFARYSGGSVHPTFIDLSAVCVAAAIALLASFAFFTSRSPAAAAVAGVFGFVTAGAAIASPLIAGGWNGDSIQGAGAGVWGAVLFGLIVGAVGARAVRASPTRNYTAAVVLVVVVGLAAAIAYGTTRPDDDFSAPPWGPAAGAVSARALTAG